MKEPLEAKLARGLEAKLGPVLSKLHILLRAGTGCISGILTAIIIAMVTPYLLIGEMGGPADFRAPLLVIVVVALLLTALLCGVKGLGRGFLYGLSFSAPIVLVCLVAGRILERSPGGAENARQFRVVMLVTPLVSIVGTGIICEWRQVRCRSAKSPKNNEG